MNSWNREVSAMSSILVIVVNSDNIRDAIHTHFVTLIGKWTIVGGWVKQRADKRGLKSVKWMKTKLYYRTIHNRK